MNSLVIHYGVIIILKILIFNTAPDAHGLPDWPATALWGGPEKHQTVDVS